MSEYRGLLKPAQVAEILNVAPQTLTNWRHRGEGPKYFKIGSAVRYSPEVIDHFIEMRERQTRTAA